jgi:hypothetical protein
MVSARAVGRPPYGRVQLPSRSTAMDRDAATGTMKLEVGMLYGC